MSRNSPPLLSFLQELKRRRVVRALLVCLASAFAVMEATDILISALSLPEWVLQAAIAVLAVGLPVTLVLSWIYDLTPEGVVHDQAPEASGSDSQSIPGPSGWLSAGSMVLGDIRRARWGSRTV